MMQALTVAPSGHYKKLWESLFTYARSNVRNIWAKLYRSRMLPFQIFTDSCTTVRSGRSFRMDPLSISLSRLGSYLYSSRSTQLFSLRSTQMTRRLKPKKALLSWVLWNASKVTKPATTPHCLQAPTWLSPAPKSLTREINCFTNQSLFTA